MVILDLLVAVAARLSFLGERAKRNEMMNKRKQKGKKSSSGPFCGGCCGMNSRDGAELFYGVPLKCYLSSKRSTHYLAVWVINWYNWLKGLDRLVLVVFLHDTISLIVAWNVLVWCAGVVALARAPRGVKWTRKS